MLLGQGVTPSFPPRSVVGLIPANAYIVTIHKVGGTLILDRRDLVGDKLGMAATKSTSFGLVVAC